MALGGGKYNAEAQAVRDMVKAEGVLLVVINGDRGTGFECQCSIEDTLRLPQILRMIADEIERSGPSA